MPTNVEDILQNLDRCMLRDRHRLRRRLRGLQAAIRAGKEVSTALDQIFAAVEHSQSQLKARAAAAPRLAYPPELPVVQRRDEIAQAIKSHQVVIVCGETGSGKTTQLPKICVELGRGVAGMIGHTQPRRLAARSVAMRIADELETPLGKAVGYKIRFTDRTSPDSYIKLMTDGILLAETQNDRFLEQYDTLIIDEAHERSLNIDFLLGYIKQLLPKRPDMKVIITSATIDPQRFSRHFDNAPIIEVSGRTYPVEVRYRPLQAEDPDEEDLTQIQGILNAVDEVSAAGFGDVLVFLSGEREIRETAEALRKHHPPHTEILPLYSRLSADEQMRIFQQHGNRRIVLATNVAETSLTVPGIKYVVDPGYARISRYSPRTKVQRLPIEPISQASANQRAGRCGRVSEGICIRLYSEEDYRSRQDYTDPEILRTNLASVILQMKAYGLGDIQTFPFIDPPDYRAVKDGYHTLTEIGALDEKYNLTPLGRMLARLPIDPRIGRMVLQADREDCLEEVLIIGAALSVQDPRERPMEKQNAADIAHGKFRDERSDFLSFLNLWDWYHHQQRHLSNSKLRKACHANFISYMRMREWIDIHHQVRTLIAEMGLRLSGRFEPEEPNEPVEEGGYRRRQVDYEAIHRALLAGLLSNIGMKTDAADYLGARGTRFFIFPGSALFKSKPQWVMAGEIVETTKLYARTVARIQPHWVERLAQHLVKRTYTEPHWHRESAHVRAYEKVTLYGLPIVPKRSVHYGPIDPIKSRELFIQHALVEGEYNTDAPYFRHNNRLIREIELIEAKRRQRDLLVDARTRFAFYDARIPAGIYNGPLFEKWRRPAEKENPRRLFMSEADLMLHAAEDATADQYPDAINVNSLEIPLAYKLDPGDPADGVTATIPLAALNQLPLEPFQWLVPGMIREKVIELIRSLPKSLRVTFVPVPEYAQRCLTNITFGAGSLYDHLAKCLGKIAGVEISPHLFAHESLPAYLMMNFRIINDAGEEVAMGRDLVELRQRLRDLAKQTFAATPQSDWHRDNLTRWDFGDLPDRVEVQRHGMTLQGFPALVDNKGSVALRLLDSPDAAREANRRGVRRLFMVQLREEMKYLARKMPEAESMCLHYAPLGSCDELKHQIVIAAADRALYSENTDIRTQQAFVRLAETGWRRLSEASNQIVSTVAPALKVYHDLSLELARPVPPLLQPPVWELREHLARLVYKNFVAQTPFEWLQHLPRYLRSIQLRLQKLKNAGLNKDRQAASTLSPLWQRYRERQEKHRERAVVDPHLQLYRWMLEELHVSLFAQELKTSMPISLPRLEEQWRRVQP